VAVTAPDQQRLGRRGRPHPAQIAGLLAFAPVGELHAERLGRVGLRGDVKDSLVRPQAPAQLQRCGDQPAHVGLSQVASVVRDRRDGHDRAGRVRGWPRQRLHGQPPHPGPAAPDHTDAHVPGPDAARQAVVCLVGHHHPCMRESPPDQVLHRTPALHPCHLQQSADTHHPGWHRVIAAARPEVDAGPLGCPW
jgi:hypothetical protein